MTLIIRFLSQNKMLFLLDTFSIFEKVSSKTSENKHDNPIPKTPFLEKINVQISLYWNDIS